MIYNIKRVVNDPETWNALVEYLEAEKQKSLQKLVLSADSTEIYRTQGRISAYESLLRLKESVNGKSAK